MPVSEETGEVLRLSPKRAYFQVILIFFCVALVNTTNYTIVGLQTSLYELLGAVSLGVAFLSWTIISPFASILITFFGLKITIIVSIIVMTSYAAANFYPSWYTLLPGNILFGTSSGIMLPVTSVYMNVIAAGLAQYREKDAKDYISRLQGVPVAACYAACVIGNVVSTSILSFQETKDEYFNGTNTTFVNVSTNESHISACERELGAVNLLPWQYPSLVSFCVILCIVSISLSFGIISVPGRGPVCRSQISVTRQAKMSLIAIAKACIKVKYFLVFPMKILDGMGVGFFFGVFTLHFITRCLNLSIVGICVLFWSLSLALAGAVVGRLSLFTSRTLLGVLMALCQLVMLLFMLLWTREPSYAAVFLISSGLGLWVGVWSTLVSIYLGIVGKEEREPVFSLYWTFHGLGDTIIFFISSSVSLEAHLAILMSLLPVCFCGYIIAEMVYGEHRERRSKLKDLLRVKRRNAQGPVETTASVNMVAVELNETSNNSQLTISLSSI